MPVPSFQEMFLPVLQFFADGQPHKMAEVAEHVANHFKLSPEERQEPIPSGQVSKLANRVGWCRTHLKFAGLLERVASAQYRITEAGLNVLQNPPPRMDLRFLDTI